MADYLSEMVRYVCGCRFENLPSEVVDRAKLVVADTTAVIAAGAQEEEVKKLAQKIAPRNQSTAAILIGAGQRTNTLEAALINGTAGTFLELDEGNQFGRGHPAIHVYPAVLAMAEEGRFSGKALITALVLGYEIGTRIGIACKLRMSMHPHGTWGTVGAAVSVGKLMGYDEPSMRRIINVSSSLGLATSRRTMLEGGTVRNVYSGASNHMGILAHHLVQSGFTGEADGLNTVYGSVVSDFFSEKSMTEDLGSRFEIARNYFKRHACCRYNHSTLDAVTSIVSQSNGGRINPENVAQVEVETYSLAAQLCSQQVDNMLAAKFSIPFAVATALINGSTGVDSFRPAAIEDDRVKDLMKRVQVKEDPSLTAMMPGRRPARVVVTLKDGVILRAESFINKGDSEDPYNLTELKEKYDDLSRLAWNQEVSEAIHSKISRLETLDDINELTNLMVDER